MKCDAAFDLKYIDGNNKTKKISEKRMKHRSEREREHGMERQTV